MPLSEFNIIQRFFASGAKPGCVPATLGIGDDCALLEVPNGMQLAVSTDTLIEGVHFLAHSAPLLLGHKVLAVNLSDLAAMGAKPAWFSLALTLPNVDEAWLGSFSEGLFHLAQKHQMQLIGGDTTRGALSISVTVMGLLEKGKGLKRSGAKVGDGVYVTGQIGSGGLGLQKAKKNIGDAQDDDLMRYLQPQPCVDAGLKLLDLATACIDVSDGLFADLNHLLQASKVGAELDHACLPMSAGVREAVLKTGDWQRPYTCGDDYQLCFTMPIDRELSFNEATWGELEKPVRIGRIVKKSGLKIHQKGGKFTVETGGYDHFNAE